MILPDKFTTPNESLFARGSHLVKILLVCDKLSIDELYDLYNHQNKIWFDGYCNTLTFLYIINVIEIKDKVINLKRGAV